MKKLFIIFVLLSAITLLAAPVYTNAESAGENACQTGLQSLNLTPVAVVCGAALDAINPCEFAVLILLMASLLALKDNRRKALRTGLSFVMAVFIAYFLIGVGLLEFIRTYTISFSGIFYRIVAVLAIIIGLLNIKDYFWYGGGGFTMEVPPSWRPKMKGLIRSVTTPIGAFVAGLMVSLFLLPCTSGPYVVILGLLASKTNLFNAVIYLIVYNLIFIAPMLAIVLAMYWGLSPERAENWRQEKIRLLHLIAGIVLVLLGITMLVGWI